MPAPQTDERVVLVLTPVADPLAKHGGVSRKPTYRLKLALKELLRKYGFRCVAARDPKKGEADESAS